jgi:hypothetical protein
MPTAKNLWSDETHKWPHTKTIHMSNRAIREMTAWLRDHCQHCGFYVSVLRRQFTASTGLYSVVVYIQDNNEDLWTLFKLTWGWNQDGSH